MTTLKVTRPTPTIVEVIGATTVQALMAARFPVVWETGGTATHPDRGDFDIVIDLTEHPDPHVTTDRRAHGDPSDLHPRAAGDRPR